MSASISSTVMLSVMLLNTFSTVRKEFPFVLSIRIRNGFHPPFLHPGPFSLDVYSSEGTHSFPFHTGI